MDIDLINKFKNREVKAKEIFNIFEINKTVAYDFAEINKGVML